jgi:2,4-dienoyl-CoA reductase-like NADH-dependent reductase (Old Yellow Enzyme family)
MSEKYPRVFSPIRIGPVEVPNRIYLSPHGNPLSAGGAPSDDFAFYYGERAAGGIGLALQSLPAVPAIVGRQTPFLEDAIPSFAAVAELMHSYGTKIFGQLQYWWSSAGNWETLSPGRPSLGPSARQRFDNYEVTHALSRPEIKAMVEAFRQSAANLARAGYDGIEFHCAHGIIGEQFLSPYWNARTDEYGGTVQNRMRFVVEVLDAIRDVTEGKLAVGIRFNCDEMLPGGWDQSGAAEILSGLSDQGLIDFANLDVGVEPNQFPLGMPNYQIPKLSNQGYAANLRRHAGDAVILSTLGRVTEIADAERALEAGSTDLVGITRGLMAEPELVKHAREGNEHLSRTCIACNWCMDSQTHPATFGCAINPATVRERRWGVRTLVGADSPSNVVVVGGGPAGLEAARVAARRGHHVVLFEREMVLGGQYVQWASLPGRDNYYKAIEYYGRVFPALGVEVRLGREASAADILAEKPDAVIVATGARYLDTGESGFMAAPIPGADKPFVYSPHQILEGGARPTGNVLILDDEALSTGVGIAEILAKNGATVEFVTRWLHVGHNLFGTFEFPLIVALLKTLGVRLSPQTYIKEIRDREVTLFDVLTNAEETRRDIDGVVVVTMRSAIDSLSSELEGKVDQLFTVGDALAPRGHGEAFYEGAYFARLIGTAGAPATFAEAYFRPQSADAYPSPAATIQIPAGSALR